MHTIISSHDDGEIVINHNGDWSGIAIVRSTIGGDPVAFQLAGRSLVAGDITATIDAPMRVVARAVSMAAADYVLRVMADRVEDATADIRAAMYGVEP